MKNLRQLIIEQSKLTWPNDPEDWLVYNCLEHEYEFYMRNYCNVVHIETKQFEGWKFDLKIIVCEIPDGDNIRYFQYTDFDAYGDICDGESVGYTFEGMDNVKEVFKHNKLVLSHEYLESPTKEVKTHKFTLVLLNQKDNTQIEKILYDAGCNDGLVCYYGDTVYVEFEREGEDRGKLIKSAMKNLRTVASIYSIPVENVITQ